MIRVWLPLASRSELKHAYGQQREAFYGALQELHRSLSRQLEASGVRATVKSRVKSFESTYEKLLRKLKHVDNGAQSIEIHDVLGLRVVCPFLDDIPSIEEHLRELFSVETVNRKGSQFGADQFGYESIHYRVHLPQELIRSYRLDDEAVCEIQIRTILQDAWAEVEHELVYKAETTPFDEPVRRKLAAVNGNLTLADIVFQEVREYQRRVQSQRFRRRMDFWNRIHREAGLKPHVVQPKADEAPTNPTNDESADGGAPSRSEADVPVESDGRPGSSETEQPADAANGDPEAAEGTPQTPDLVDPSGLPSQNARVDALLLEALQAHNRQAFQEAIDLYTQLLDSGPRAYVAAVAHTHRGMAHFALSAYQSATEDFTRTLELDDENWKACFYRGLVHRIRGDYEAALGDFDRCVQIQPYQFDAFHARAQLLYELGHYAAAEVDCRRAMELQPEAEPVRELAQLISNARASAPRSDSADRN
jgi:putative GTP pyrophosphokinase